ncbi:MAG: rRNA (guanine-N1)-methyltransferase, partial [Thauera sp.]
GFAVLGSDRLRFMIGLDGRDTIADLLAMTPHLHRATAEGRARAAALTAIELSVDVLITRFVRCSGTRSPAA